MTTLTGKLLDATGAAIAGAAVSASLVGGPFLADGTGRVNGSASTTTAGDGSWSLILTPNTAVEGTSYYLVREAGQLWTVTIPATGTVRLRDALIQAPDVTVPAFGLSRAVADGLYQPLAGYSGWTDISSFTAGMIQTADATMSPGGCRTEPGGVVRLRGQLDATGVIAAGSTSFTLPAAFWPSKVRRMVSRLSSTVVRVTVGTDGACQLTAATANGNQLLLDGLTYTI